MLGIYLVPWLVSKTLGNFNKDGVMVWAVRIRTLARDIVDLGKALNSHSASLHPSVQMGTGNLMLRLTLQ